MIDDGSVERPDLAVFNSWKFFSLGLKCKEKNGSDLLSSWSDRNSYTKSSNGNMMNVETHLERFGDFSEALTGDQPQPAAQCSAVPSVSLLGLSASVRGLQINISSPHSINHLWEILEIVKDASYADMCHGVSCRSSSAPTSQHSTSPAGPGLPHTFTAVTCHNRVSRNRMVITCIFSPPPIEQ